MKLVVDSSVIIKWLNTTEEKNVSTANKILDDALDNKVEITVPELVKYEIGNVLFKGKNLTPQEATVILRTFHSLPITFVSESEELAEETYLQAYNNKITYYDASFISLAKLYNAKLVTDNVKHQGRSSEIKIIALKDY